MNWITQYPHCLEYMPEGVSGQVAIFTDPQYMDKSGLFLRYTVGAQVRDSIVWFASRPTPQNDKVIQPQLILIGSLVNTRHSFTESCVRKGPGGMMAIDACRVPVDRDDPNRRPNSTLTGKRENTLFFHGRVRTPMDEGRHDSRGRFPNNVLWAGESASIVDAQGGDRPSNHCEVQWGYAITNKIYSGFLAQYRGAGYGDNGGASRYAHTFDDVGQVKDFLLALFGQEHTVVTGF